MQKLTVNGVQIAYERHGAGAALLLIHGFPLDHSSWDALLPHLDGFDVIVPDLRGFGQSGIVAGIYTVDDMAADLVGLLEALQVEKAVVAGHSMGGYIALAIARNHKEKLAGLGLVSTQALPDTPERKTGRYATAEQVAAQGSIVVADAMAPKLSANPAHVPAIRESILHQPAAGIIGALKAMAERPDATALLAGFTFPVAIICGQNDALIPPDRSREMKTLIPQASLTELPGVGHMPMLEAPSETAAALRKLL